MEKTAGVGLLFLRHWPFGGQVYLTESRKKTVFVE